MHKDPLHFPLWIRIRVLEKAPSWISAAKGRAIRRIIEQFTLQSHCTLTIAYTYDPTNSFVKNARRELDDCVVFPF